MFNQSNNLGLIVVVVFIIVFVIGVISSIKKANKIKKEGIETKATISRVEYDTDSDDSTYEKFYVSYLDNNGIQRESLLSNASVNAKVGDQIRIRYLENDYQIVIEVKD